MRKVNLYFLAAGAALAVSTAHADGALQGLEMDVMNANETAAHATSRIALPRPGDVVESNAQYLDPIVEQNRVGGGQEDAAAVSSVHAPALPDSGSPGIGIAIGEPAPDGSGSIGDEMPSGDPASGVDVGEAVPSEPETLPMPVQDPLPIDTGEIEPMPGDAGLIDPPMPHEIPIGEIPEGGSGTDDVVGLPSVETVLPDASDASI